MREAPCQGLSPIRLESRQAFLVKSSFNIQYQMQGTEKGEK
jgi:hypothetical protein